MSVLRFSDGQEFDTSGSYRTIHRADGFYVIGNGFLCPVEDEEEAQRVIDMLATKSKGEPHNGAQ
jgi:hypothetical protein